MVPLLAIAGISLTASAVSWWNGRRTAEVQEEIDALEAQLAQIHAADAKARSPLVNAYLRNLNSLVDQELTTRNDVATELGAGYEKAREILKRPFGSLRESGSFRQIVLELDLALNRINAERAYLRQLKIHLSSVASGAQSKVPSPGDLQLPNDFPREAGLVHFDGKIPKQLHGYRLKEKDWSSDLNGRAMLFNVNH